MLRTGNINCSTPDGAMFDQNISFRVTKKIQDFFPDSKHVSDVACMIAKTLKYGNTQRIKAMQLLLLIPIFMESA